MDIQHNIDPFAAQLRQAPGIIREEFLRSTDRLTLQGVAIAQGIVAVKTGHLRRSIAHKAAVWSGGARGEYGTATPYARAVEFGRRGFSARAGGYLRFMGTSGIVFTKSVGPAAAQPFMRPSAERLRPLVNREYRAAMQRAGIRLGFA